MRSLLAIRTSSGDYGNHILKVKLNRKLAETKV